jgi:hypothetical protein
MEVQALMHLVEVIVDEGGIMVGLVNSPPPLAIYFQRGKPLNPAGLWSLAVGKSFEVPSERIDPCYC